MLALGMSEWPNYSGFGKLLTKLLPQLLSGSYSRDSQPLRRQDIPAAWTEFLFNYSC